MNISYKWLREYVDFDLSADEVAKALTSIGLEVDGVEEVQSIRGGLQGIVIGEVLTCEPHPNSDHMHVCTVNLGQGEPEQIVCGAPNVAAGQKVLFATIGTVLPGDFAIGSREKMLEGTGQGSVWGPAHEMGHALHSYHRMRSQLIQTILKYLLHKCPFLPAQIEKVNLKFR